MPSPLPGLTRTQSARPRTRLRMPRELPRKPPRRAGTPDTRRIARDPAQAIPPSAHASPPTAPTPSGTTQSQGGRASQGARVRAPSKTDGSSGRTRSRVRAPDLEPIRRKILVKGLAVVDGRLHAARVIKRWQRELANDLGGMGALSTAQRTLLELSTRTRLLLEHVDAELMQRKTIILKRKGKLLPLVGERMKIADVLTRQLLALGLERKSTVIQALPAYIEQKYTTETESPR